MIDPLEFVELDFCFIDHCQEAFFEFHFGEHVLLICDSGNFYAEGFGVANYDGEVPRLVSGGDLYAYWFFDKSRDEFGEEVFADDFFPEFAVGNVEPVAGDYRAVSFDDMKGLVVFFFIKFCWGSRRFSISVIIILFG